MFLHSDRTHIAVGVVFQCMPSRGIVIHSLICLGEAYSCRLLIVFVLSHPTMLKAKCEKHQTMQASLRLRFLLLSLEFSVLSTL